MRIFNRVTVGGKLIAVSLVFAAPIGFVLWSLIAEKQISINFTNNELDGSAYVATVRGAMMAAAAAPERLGAATATLQATSTRLADRLGVVQETRTFLDTSAKAGTGRAARNDAFVAALDLIGKVGDNSELTLDPQLDSHYTMDAVVVQAPRIIARLQRLAGSVASFAGKAALAADERTDLLITKGGLEDVIANLRSDLDSAFKGNPDGSVKAGLEASTGQASAALDGFVAATARATDARSRRGGGSGERRRDRRDGNAVERRQQPARPAAERTGDGVPAQGGGQHHRLGRARRGGVRPHPVGRPPHRARSDGAHRHHTSRSARPASCPSG